MMLKEAADDEVDVLFIDGVMTFCDAYETLRPRNWLDITMMDIGLKTIDCKGVNVDVKMTHSMIARVQQLRNFLTLLSVEKALINRVHFVVVGR